MIRRRFANIILFLFAALIVFMVFGVAGLGGTPYRDGSFEYYVQEPIATNDFKGAGPFILAALELEKAELMKTLDF